MLLSLHRHLKQGVTMQRRLLPILCALGVTALATPGNRYVIPLRDGVGVYLNQIRAVYETPLFTISTADRLLVIQETTQHLKVQNIGGDSGWVERRLVTSARLGLQIDCSITDVIGFIDINTPKAVIGMPDPISEPIRLDRSFADALRENSDRETIERIASTK
jgi:hypothetical protein